MQYAAKFYAKPPKSLLNNAADFVGLLSFSIHYSYCFDPSTKLQQRSKNRISFTESQAKKTHNQNLTKLSSIKHNEQREWVSERMCVVCNSFDEYVIFNVQTIAHNAIFAVDHYCNNEWSWRWWWRWRATDLTYFFCCFCCCWWFLVFYEFYLKMMTSSVVATTASVIASHQVARHFIHTTIINIKLKYSCSIQTAASIQMVYIYYA